MVHHIPVVGGLQIFQGALECVMGVFLLIMTFAVPSILRDMPNMFGPEMEMPSPAFLMILYGLLGLLLLAVGGLRIVAGVLSFRYRGRILGIVSLGAGLTTLLACYCFPTALALFIYGLVVYLRPDVVRAFEMRKQGASPEEIRATLR
jgi:hypothetical protein